MIRKSRVLVIIPAYNEERSIGGVIKKVQQSVSGVDILVIDDGSSDGTVKIAREAGASVICLPFNLGYGAALQTGYKYASEKKYGCVVQIDADGQHDARCINDLLSVLGSDVADIVVGSRFLENRGYKVPWVRRVGIRILGAITSFIIKKKITDSSSGFRALRREVVDFFANIDYPSDYDDADVIILTHFASFRIKEVPVTMYQSSSGKSLLSGPRFVYYGFKMLLSIIVTLLREKPQRRK